MKILYFTKIKEINESNMSQWQIEHIVNELRIKGWEIELFFPFEAESKDEVNSKLISHLKKKKYDLFLSTCNEKVLFTESLGLIRKLGVASVLLCFDNLVLPYEHKNIAKYYDIVWLTSWETEYLFKRWGANTIFLPYAASPYLIPKDKTAKYIKKVCFVGTPYGARKHLLNKFVENEIPIDIYGTIKSKNNKQILELNNKADQLRNMMSFPIGRKLLQGTIKYRFFEKDCDLQADNISYMKPVPVLDVPNLYEKYALSLSSTSARNTEVLRQNVPIVNLRSFEIPMSFGLQICRYNKELASYFEEDKEILFYRSDEELSDKTRFYTRESNNETVMTMKLAARKRAECEHTWYCRFNSLASVLNLH